MEKPETIWDGRYQAQRIENWISETAFCYRFPIYTVTKQKIKYGELIKAIYNYMKKRFRSNYGKYYDRVLTIAFHYTEAPYRLTATFMRDEKIIWSTDPAEQEETKKYLDWQAVEQFYNDLRNKCNFTVEQRTAARKIIENIGKITVKLPNIRLIQYKNSVKIKENYLCSNKKAFDRDIYITKDHDKNNYWSMFSELYEKMGGVTITRSKKKLVVDNDYDCSEYFDDDAIFLNDWYAEDDDYQQEDYVQYIKNKLDLTVDYLNYPHRMILHHFWDHERDIVFWSQDKTEQDAVKKEFSCWKAIEAFYNAYFERRRAYIEKNIVEVANFYATEERKEKTREQRKNNDPNSLLARKQRARRHLKQLGYTLFKSNKIHNFTDDDRGQYKVTDTNGKAVLGSIFDATLNDVERFYTALDKKRWPHRYNVDAAEEKKPERDLKRENKVATQLKKYGFVLDYDEYDATYNIEDSLGYTMEYCKNIKKVEKIVEKLKKKGFKERESPVKQKKILDAFDKKISSYQDIWVQVGFDWESTERNKGYMIVDSNRTLLGLNYSLTLDDIETYLKGEGREYWQKENAARYQLRKKGYLLRKKRVRDCANYTPHEFQIINAGTKEIISGAEIRLTLEEVERWIADN